MTLRKQGARSLASRGSGAPSSSIPKRRQTKASRGASAEVQRHAIANLAEAIFAERGYAGATIRVVAARAGCSVGQIYKLYPNKLELYRAILEGRMGKLAEVLDETMAEPTSVCERLDRIVRATLLFFQENSAFFRIYSQEADLRLPPGSRRHRERIARLRQHGLDRVAELIRAGQDNGELRRDLDPADATVSLFGMVKGHAAERFWHGAETPLEAQAAPILELFLRGARSEVPVRTSARAGKTQGGGW